MKKQAIIITAALLTVALAGCSQKGAQTTGAAAPAATTAAETTTEATTTTAATTTADTTTTAETTTTEAEVKLPEERLFGGYINSDKDEELLSSPDGKVLTKIPGGTQIEVYESDKEGWYLTEFDGKKGYIKAETVEEIPDYDMDEYEPSFADIAGNWIYEEQDAGVTDSYQGMPIGHYTITEDGTYSYTTDGISFTNGTIEIIYEEYIDGSKVPWFTFLDENGEVFMACYAERPEDRTDGALYIGQDGISRLVPDYGNAIGGTDNYSEPNEYGYYEFPAPPESGVSVAALSGAWENAGKPGEVLVISNGSDIYNGIFACGNSGDEGAAASGVVKLEFRLEDDNTQAFMYTFYLEDGTLWNAFTVTGDIPLDTLTSADDESISFVRFDSTSVADIVGVWNEEDVLDSRTLTVNEDGSFRLEYRGGGAQVGIVQVDYESHPDGSFTPWFVFTDNGGDVWEGFQKTDESPMNDLYAGHTGEPHFTRAQ